MKRQRLYLQDMLDSMNRIANYIQGESYDTFVNHQMLVDAVVRNLEIIGEAAGKVSDKLRERVPEVPWKQMKGLRNILIHEYFGIDKSIIWNIAFMDLPKARAQIEQIIAEEVIE